MNKKILAFLFVVLTLSMVGCSTSSVAPQYTPQGMNPSSPDVPASDSYDPMTFLEEHGTSTLNSDGTVTYRTAIGEHNTWNGKEWVHYIYNEGFDYLDENSTHHYQSPSVRIGDITFSHLSNGVISVNHTGSGFAIEGLKWYAQYYFNDAWQNFTFDNYAFDGVDRTDESITAYQRWWSTNGELNVSYTYSYQSFLKMRAQATNLADVSVPVRIIWAALGIQVSGVDYSLIWDEDVKIGVDIGNAQQLFWHDVLESAPEIAINTVVDKPNRRAAVVFGNISSVLAPYETMDIDPTYTLAADIDDDYWYDITGTPVHQTATIDNRFHYEIDNSFRAQQRFSLSIPQGSTITSADWHFYVSVNNGVGSCVIHIIDEDNVGSLEGDSSLPDEVSGLSKIWTSSGGPDTWGVKDVKTLVQYQVDRGGWASDNYIGMTIATQDTDTHYLEDYSNPETHHSYMVIVWEFPSIPPVNYEPTLDNPDDTDNMYAHYKQYQITQSVNSTARGGGGWLTGFTYRKYHRIIGATGAGTNYQIKLDVNYGAGSSFGSSVYLNSLCQTDFGDINFTDSDGETPLDYWIEEKTDSDDATFWVEVQDSLESGNVPIFIYWGTVGTTTTSSDGEATMILFDNFNDASLDTDKWDQHTGSSVEANGYLQLDGTDHIVSDDAYTAGVATGARVYWKECRAVGFVNVPDWWNDALFLASKSTVEGMYSREDASTTADAYDFDEDTWLTIETAWYSGDLTKGYLAHSEITSIATNVPSDAMSVYFYTYEPDDELLRVDWVYVRKVVLSEPSHDAWGQQDKEGFNDIDYMEMSLYSDNQVTEYWKVRYDEDTDTFSEQTDTSNMITLDTGTSSATESGIWCNVTYYITIHWNHVDTTDTDAKCYSVDTLGDADEPSWYEVDWNVETRLDFSSFSLDDDSGTPDRGNYDTQNSIDADGVIEYFGSSSNLYPPDDVMDIWITCPDTPDKGLAATDAGAFHITVDSDDVVGLDTYTFKIVQDGAGHEGADECHDTHTDEYIADRVQVQQYTMTPDGRINIGSNIIFRSQLFYDYDNSDVEDGTITFNGDATNHYVDGWWQNTENEAAVTSKTYNTVAISGDTHGMTSVDQNGQSCTGIWDRVQVQSYSVSDARDNINDNVDIDVTLWYDFDDTLMTDGTVTINGFNAAHQGSGVWRITRTSASVTSVTYNNVQCTGNTHGITVEDQNGQSQQVIWDRVQVQSYTVVDTRVNVNDNVNIDVLLWYDFDDAQVTDGTVTINGFAADHQGSGVWRITRTSASVTDVTYDTIVVTGNTHGITVEDQNSQEETVVWDRIKILLVVTNSTYNDLNDDVLLTVQLEYEFDHAAITTGTFSLRYSSVYLTLTHDASGNWTVTDSSASTTSRTYNFVNGTATLYSITVVNMDSKSVTVHWDIIILDIEISLTWTVVGYNVTITITGEYDGLGYVWNGTATFNSTWTAPFYPEYSTAANRSFVVTSITNDDMDLVGFATASVWCIWDNVAFSSPIYHWVQYSVDQVWLIWYAGATTYWEINGTCTGVKIQSHMNLTDDDWTYVLNNATGEVCIGPFTTAWYFVNITINGEYSGYDWVVWTRMFTVDILHSIHIEDSGMDIQDNWITFIIHTNWANASFTIWDNTTLVGHSGIEGWYQIAKPTVVGLHNYTVLVNGTHGSASESGQTKDFSVSDSWVWRNFKFTVNPVTFSITELWIAQNNESIVVQGFWHTPNTTLTWIAYEAGVQIDNGVLTLTASGEYSAIYWEKNEPTQFRNFTLSITADGSTINLHSYSYVLDSATYLTTVSGGGQVIIQDGDYYFEEITHENPPGFYITAETAAIIAVCGVFIAFFAYLFADRVLKSTRLKTEEKGQQ